MSSLTGKEELQDSWEQLRRYILRLCTDRGARVVVAMSGGVDSSTVAAAFSRLGYDVVGITMKLYPSRKGVHRGCCGESDVSKAVRIARHFGFAHYIIGAQEPFFRQVVDPFVQEYRAGRTPSPCVLCNEKIKFGLLVDHALKLGARYVVTGHYARVEMRRDAYALYMARDPRKDQSYYLFSIPEHVLSVVRLPLGNFRKEETRNVALFLGLDVAQKSESQDLCFVPDGDYGRYIEARLGTCVPGPLKDVHGSVLGRHRGIAHYTVGQRRKLGIGGNLGPLYVKELDARRNVVVVAKKSKLATMGVKLRDVRWFDDPTALPHGLTAKYRSLMQPVPVTICCREHAFTLTFSRPQYGVAPGQACVVYQGDRVVGGGWMESSCGVSGHAVDCPGRISSVG